MLSDWAHVQGSSVVQHGQHEYDVKKKHQEHVLPTQIFV